jgi:Ser/Thr protein kinase RdoA (MazF antagonist)
MIVETSKGVFLAKTYTRLVVVIDSLNFQHRLSEHLFTNGLPVARIQKAISGKGYVEVDDWVLELQEFVKGEPMTLTLKNIGSFSKSTWEVS